MAVCACVLGSDLKFPIVKCNMLCIDLLEKGKNGQGARHHDHGAAAGLLTVDDNAVVSLRCN